MKRTKPSPSTEDMRQKLSDDLDTLEDLVPFLNDLFTTQELLKQIETMRKELPTLKSKQQFLERRASFKMLTRFADSAFLS
jgi:hypothetical protein